MATTSRPRRLSWIALPLLPWALHFVAIYSLQGLVCARGWSQPAGMGGMVVLTLMAFAAIAWIGVRAWRVVRTRDAGQHGHLFAARVVLLLSALSMVAVAFTSMPLLLLAPCE